MHTYKHPCMHPCIQNRQACMHTYINRPACVHASIHTKPTCMRACIHTCKTDMRACIHTYIHTKPTCMHTWAHAYVARKRSKRTKLFLPPSASLALSIRLPFLRNSIDQSVSLDKQGTHPPSHPIRSPLVHSLEWWAQTWWIWFIPGRDWYRRSLVRSPLPCHTYA
jgi:hypothetical protein